jgi:hypothetical protein
LRLGKPVIGLHLRYEIRRQRSYSEAVRGGAGVYMQAPPVQADKSVDGLCVARDVLRAG